MADEIEEKQDETTAEPVAPPTGGGGRTLFIAFVAVVVLIETAMFFFLVPSAEDVSALAEAKLIKSVQEVDAEAEEQASDENKVQEFQLGMYGEVFSPHDTERNYRVELDLYGLIRKKNADKMKLEFTDKEGRLRNAIRRKIRNSSLEELNENNLGLLERRILTSCNHLLEEDLLLAVGFKSYQLLEQ
ncbi:dihydrolipoamide acetyltransferase [Rubripirellula amarantea]|nr:dihydrolipoamide acetyltransferase [Rubripirellula amarantea]